eukprot:gene5580-7705_t
MYLMKTISKLWNKSFCLGIREIQISRISSTIKQTTKISQIYNKNRSQSYDLVNGNEVKKIAKSNKIDQTETLQKYVHAFTSYVQPKGYPHSVAPKYFNFASGQFISSILSTAGGVLSMQAMLIAIGVGSGSLPIAATLNWILKDGLGQLGGVIFAGLVNNQFDSEPKKWRMIAALSLEGSCLIEMLTPLAPGYFLILASIANIGKNISYLSASASRAAIHRSFSIHENLADITAKTGSQSILASVIGTSLGLFISSTVGETYFLTLTSFLTCSSLSIFATYLSLKDVSITAVNLNRLEMLLNGYYNNDVTQADEKNSSQYILTPEQVTNNELLLTSQSPSKNLATIKIGEDLDAAFASSVDFKNLFPLFSNENFIICAYSSCISQETNRNSVKIHLLYRETATQADMIRGIAMAYLVRKAIYEDIKSCKLLSERKEDKLVLRIDIIQRVIKDQLETTFPSTSHFTEHLIKNERWRISVGMLEPRYARIKY